MMVGLDWLGLARMAAVLIAAILIGNWFLAEVRKSKIKQEPWYKPYVSLPGLIIIAALSLPLFFLLFNR
jgi:hypothetical protein